MAEIIFYGGPCDGRVETLRDCCEFNGELVPRDGWPLIMGMREYSCEKPSEEVFLATRPPQGGGGLPVTG